MKRVKAMPDNESDAFYDEIGRRIGIARRKFNWTQQELADSVGLTRTSVTNIESGRQKLLLHTAVKIAGQLNIDIGEILPQRKEMRSSLDRVVDEQRKQMLMRMIPEIQE